FVFSGQGGQWTGMGRSLLACAPAFRAAFLRCDRAVAAVAGWSPLAALESDLPPAIDRLQPLIFAVQIALAALWRDAGAHPDIVIGHSMGEVAAAVAGGHLSLADGARIICARSTVMRRTAGAGAMLAVALPRDRAAGLLSELGDTDTCIAVENAPGAVVLSGTPAALQSIGAALQARGVECGFVRVDVASHSPQMEPLLPELAAEIAEIRPLPGDVPFISAVRADRVASEALGVDYWCDNLRHPVRFAAAVSAILRQPGQPQFVELGPHPVLADSLERCLTAADRPGQVLASMVRDADEREAVHATAQRLRAAGHSVWPRFAVAAPGPAVLPLSAQTAPALQALAGHVADMLVTPTLPPAVLHALAAVSGERRDHHEHRAAIVADTPSEARRLLLSSIDASDRADIPRGRRPLSGPLPIVLVCSGQGMQVAGMGLALAAAEPIVAETLREAEAAIRKCAGWSLAEELARLPEATRLGRTDIAQPALVALQLALARLLASWGLEPAAVIGHSIGEIAAAA
ncbi:MAG TPA: acyltransferase domain-containing protein, partial [Ramlibacter sp.]